ncbi:TetR family transcriptional regulator [Desulfallas sp. Bu1-1]|uniref:TetR/AcrR family transcriptional regulator n=1 Tax=Desulfallas sp. Bu1-1 TaxID=2787620 RepID=UPI0018A09D02|nr:TetR/AcrR family transcriptional regulator [Desulfallas sp. Bu1-1]MBF7082711.1 TetR family transcriptional regulator [Desulfallas sp. Bu1-1]
MDTRGKIIQSAVELFGQKGYHSTSIQEIGEHAGVSKGAIFHYFPNKSEILFVIHEKFIDIILEKADHVLHREDLSATQKLRELIVDLVQLIADFKPYVVVFFKEYKYVDEDRLAIIKAKRDRCEQIFKAVVEQGVAGGEFRRDLDIDMIVKAIFGMCDWTHQWMRPDGRLTPRQIALTFCDLLLGGLRQQVSGDRPA